MYDVITIGGATRDIFFQIDRAKVERAKNHVDLPYLRIPYGEKLVADETYYSFGGGAVNVSVALSRLGLSVACFANVGSEGTGQNVVDFLKKEKVNTSLVQRDKILHTGLSVLVLGPDGEHTGILERGANNHLRIDRLKPFKKTKWFYISSLTGDSDKILPEIFAFAERHQIRIAFNPGSRQLADGWGGLKKYLAQTEVLFLNTEEAEGLFRSKNGRKPRSERDLLSGAEEFGAAVVVVTEGEVGSHALTSGHDFHQGSCPKETVDTTGAGDSFGATFLYGIIQGYDVRYALKIASVNSASVVGSMGSTAGLLTYDRIKKSTWL